MTTSSQSIGRDDDSPQTTIAASDTAGAAIDRFIVLLQRPGPSATSSRSFSATPLRRPAGRRGYRNGLRSRTLTTRVGTLRRQISRDRAGLFRPTLFAEYERSEQGLVFAMIEMYF